MTRASEKTTTSELKIEGDAQVQFPTNDFHTAQEINDLATEVLELSMKPVKQDSISQRVKEEVGHFHDMLYRFQESFMFLHKQIVTPYSHKNGLNAVRTVIINVYHSLPAFRITTNIAVVMFSKSKMGLFEYTRLMVIVSVMDSFPDSRDIKGLVNVMLVTKS